MDYGKTEGGKVDNWNNEKIACKYGIYCMLSIILISVHPSLTSLRGLPFHSKTPHLSAKSTDIVPEIRGLV